MSTSLDASVICTYYRPGGIDITLAGMRDQTFPKDRFEIVLVDRRYERRHQEIMALASAYAIQCVHVPEHRRNGKWTTASAAWNTGIALARGRILIFLEDFAYTPPGWIEGHLGLHSGTVSRYAVCGFRRFNMPRLRLLPPYDHPPFDFSVQPSIVSQGSICTEPDPVLVKSILPEVHIFADGPFDPVCFPRLGEFPEERQEQRKHFFPRGSTVHEGYLFLNNESCHRDMMLDLNGVDERLDRGHGPIDLDTRFRLIACGAEIFFSNDPVYVTIPPDGICRCMPWGHTTQRLENRWSEQDGLAYNARRRREAAAGDWRAKNPFSIHDLVRRLDAWRVSPPTKLSVLEVPDQQYYGRLIWPETE